MNAYLNHYQQNQVVTASPEQILIMLYDGAIRFVRQAQGALSAGDRQAKATAIQKAVNIITEFRNTLDHEVGGEIAANLDALYDYMLRELIRANVGNEARPLEVVEGLLMELREAWVQAIESHRAAQKAGQAAEGRQLQAAL